MRDEYYRYIRENSVEGSGTAHSYVRALEMLGSILKSRTTTFVQYSDIWSIQSPEIISQLYGFVLIEQRKKASGIFGGHEPSSYWKQGFYSAALGSYQAFLGAYKYIQQHEELLWKIYKETKNRMNPANGICLSATYDAAFDRHLISFDDNYRLILSPSLKDHYTNRAFKEHFLAVEGRKIKMPVRSLPDHKLLGQHRGRMGV
ncbi:MAG: HNH endonuclease signature motif containing protein [Kiritimatiellae bacterium]|nr:HNH endonuclease signature motif containing protein [Kiritimatiellia bacterium]